MNADRLLVHYERVADAPDAVPRLRRFILDRAVRGKLVPQDPNDEPASELLKRIATERTRLAKLGKRKNGQVPRSDEVPFTLPNSWVWTALDAVVHVEMGQSPPSEHYNQRGEGLAFFQGKADFGLRTPTPRYWCTRPTKVAQSGDILISVRAPVGPTNVADQTCCIGRGLAGLRSYNGLDREFLLLGLRALESDLVSLGFGTTFVAVNKSQLTAFPIPVPPLAEQHRIVAKVDELMALCDRLEAARTAREAMRDRLTIASLGGLDAPDLETFRDDARFALDALPALTTRPAQIKQLRQTILNLAVQGKLVAQEANDEPAAELLKRIAEEKTRLMRAGVVPRQKESPRDPSRLTGDLPRSWLPIALGDACNMVTSGSRGWAEFYAESGAGFIRAQNIRFGKLRLDDLAFVNPPSSSEGSRTQVTKGDLLVVITGAGVTNPALIDRDLGEAYVSQHVALVRTTDKELSDWFLLCLMAPSGGRAELVDRAYGAGKPGLNLDNIRSLSIPLPPLREQRRIVAKVDELMALCDRLESSLAAGDDTRRRLLDALLAGTLAPADGAAA